MTNVEKVAAIEERLTALQEVVMNSLNLRANGGAHIINELFIVIADLTAVKEALQETPEVPEAPVEPVEPEPEV